MKTPPMNKIFIPPSNIKIYDNIINITISMPIPP